MSPRPGGRAARLRPPPARRRCSSICTEKNMCRTATARRRCVPRTRRGRTRAMRRQGERHGARAALPARPTCIQNGGDRRECSKWPVWGVTRRLRLPSGRLNPPSRAVAHGCRHARCSSDSLLACACSSCVAASGTLGTERCRPAARRWTQHSAARGLHTPLSWSWWAPAARARRSFCLACALPTSCPRHFKACLSEVRQPVRCIVSVCPDQRFVLLPCFEP